MHFNEFVWVDKSLDFLIYPNIQVLLLFVFSRATCNRGEE